MNNSIRWKTLIAFHLFANNFGVTYYKFLTVFKPAWHSSRLIPLLFVLQKNIFSPALFETLKLKVPKVAQNRENAFYKRVLD
jgi:hypothetical protein